MRANGFAAILRHLLNVDGVEVEVEVDKTMPDWSTVRLTRGSGCVGSFEPSDEPQFERVRQSLQHADGGRSAARFES